MVSSDIPAMLTRNNRAVILPKMDLNSPPCHHEFDNFVSKALAVPNADKSNRKRKIADITCESDGVIESGRKKRSPHDMLSWAVNDSTQSNGTEVVSTDGAKEPIVGQSSTGTVLCERVSIDLTDRKYALDTKPLVSHLPSLVPVGHIMS